MDEVVLSVRQRKISFLVFWITLSFIYGLVFITPELFLTSFSSFKSFALISCKWAFLTMCASGILCLLSVSRIMFALTFPLLSLVSGGVAYFQLSIGVGLSPGVVDLACANGVSVWMTLISMKLIVALAAAGMGGIIAVVIRWKYVMTDVPVVDLVVIGLSLIFVPINISPKIRESVMTRMPYTIYHSVDTYLSMRKEIAVKRTTYDGVAAKRSGRSPDVVLVIGESLRADHLPFNGYDRNTMPLLSAAGSIVSYPNIYSDSHYTHACLPLIMTDTDSLTRDSAYSEQSFITLFRKAGYRTAWFANQDLSESYAYFAHEADTIVYCNNVMSVYNFSNYLDADILPLYDQWRKASDRSAPDLAVIHTIGSHWWYKSHYPDADGNFKPELDSHDVESASHEQLVNSYDNTILETDRFLSDLIERIKDRNAIMIYISDHGENLGEHGEYLHVNGYDETRNPACLIWCSEQFAELFPEKVAAIRQNHLDKGNTDQIFHTVIDAADITTAAYSPSRSLLRFDNVCQSSGGHTD